MKRLALILAAFACVALFLWPTSVAHGQSPAARTDFVPLGVVKIEKTNGIVTRFGLGATSDTARGTALLAAQSASVAGDTINVEVGTATWTATTVIGKTGVNWNFAAGAKIQRNGNGRLWSDLAGELTGTVQGGRFLSTTATPEDDFGVGIYLHDVDSDLVFVCDELRTTDPATGQTLVSVGTGAKLRLVAHDTLSSAGYDTFNIAGGSLLTVDCPEIYGFDNCLESGGGWVSIHAHSMSSANSVLQTTGGTTELQSVVADRIFNTAAGVEVIIVSGGNLYCRSPKISGHVSVGGGTAYFDSCGIDSTGRAAPTINITGVSTVTLANCVFTTDSGQTYSLGATAARTVNVVGTLTTNKAIDPDITFAGPGTVIASGVVVYLAGQSYAPLAPSFVTGVAESGLPGEQALGLLGTGILRNTTGTGTLSIATAGTHYLSPSGDGSQLTDLDANNIGAGVLGQSFGGAGTINGILKANGAGTVSAATIAGERVSITITPMDVPTFVGQRQGFWIVPPEYNGWTIATVTLTTPEVGTTGTINVGIDRIRTGSTVDVMTVNPTIDTTEISSTTAAAQPDINESNHDLATDDVIVFGVDAIHTTPCEGLQISLGLIP